MIIDGVDIKDYGLCLYDRPNIPTPERDTEVVTIRGKNGTLTKEYGWKDIEVPVKLNLMSDTLKEDVRGVKAWILKAKEIFYADDSVFYKVSRVRMGSIENEIAEYGAFDVSFICKPFQYSLPTAVTLTAPGRIYNHGTETTEPYIKVTGTGVINLDINGRDIILTVDGYIELDTELGYAFKGTSGADDKVNGELPVLTPGENNISWTGNITKLEIVYKAVYL